MFSAGLFFILTVLNIVVHYLRKHQEEGHGERKVSSSLSSDQLCRHFSLWEIKLATHYFDEALVIGKGGFGKVYKGTIDLGSTAVAIKRLNFDGNQGAAEFRAEIDMLSMFRHSHIVSLLGYCEASQEMILVYEYMPHGSLEDHLHKRRDGRSSPQLTWIKRLKICIGAARGLEYLHTGIGVQHRVIHRDVKSSNILLDDNCEAKISDFGLSRMGPANHSCTTNVYTNQIKGTFGYMDEAYFRTRRLTRKSDVYAFGVVLFEVLCGRPAVDLRLVEEQHSLARWAKKKFKEGKLDQIIDPCLREQIMPDCLKEFGEIAYKCLRKHPKKRPTMAEVVASLESALSKQEASIRKSDAEIVSTSRADDEEDVGSINEGSVSSLSDAVIVSTETIKVHADKHPAASPIRYRGRVTFIKKAWSLFSTLTPAFSGWCSIGGACVSKRVKLRREVDVFAFGVVLFEVLCGMEYVQRSLAGWAKNNIKDGKLDQIIDPCLREQIVPGCLKGFGEIAYKCLLNRPKERPTMAEVVARPELALSLQEASTLKLDTIYEEDVGSINEGSVSSLSDAVIVSTETIKVHADKHPAASPIRYRGRVTFIKKAWSLFSTLTPAFSGHESLEAWRFAFNTIKVATGNFSNANKLTSGDYISVYKGILQNGQWIAVKRLTLCEYTDIGTINQLLWRLIKLQHRNVTRLIGFCVEGKKMYLIQEFMPRGTLKDELVCDRFREALMGWDTRYDIIVGLAHALLYLQTELPLTVPLNLRTENIMLDKHLNPKISSWAVAELLSPYDSQTFLTQEISNSTDVYTSQPYVYSCGVLILEILNGQSDYSLLRNAWRHWDEGTSSIFLQKAINSRPTEIDQARRCFQIGLLCVQIPGGDRPTMASVVNMLTNANVILPAPNKNPYGHVLNSSVSRF